MNAGVVLNFWASGKPSLEQVGYVKRVCIYGYMGAHM